ncbi:putative WD repeat-containing protein [Golovinomyces cichoracearum]|uniref:Putative WD repeat-containing protein n=1 Tax=Golovinomyces cichoracearum TaxID=62708 RepID=A0A420IPX3_9PEZI|nr:putative WD repeat-containing protein [Golovinomyces cichoracearum]
MNKSNDQSHFFQTDTSEATIARRAQKSGNKNGEPIILQSKILDVILDHSSPSCIYTAESSGCVHQVNIKRKKAVRVYRGPGAPVTSVALGGVKDSIVFGACWDKKIWSWDRETGQVSKKYSGHSDFVKKIITAKLDGKDILISGGSDSKIMVWDTVTGSRLHTLQDIGGSMLSIQDLAIDPYDSEETQIIMFSASSDPFIRKWCLESSRGKQILDIASDKDLANSVSDKSSIKEHETSVYRLLFFGDDQNIDLWTASADGKAKCLSRERSWSAEETYEHKDYVHSVVVTEDLVITAGRDEDVKIWDRATGKLYHTYEGHFDEVTGLVLIDDGKRVVSVSIDQTVRCWELGANEIKIAIKKKEESSKGCLEEDGEHISKIHMTAEEIAELNELMEEDQ